MRLNKDNVINAICIFGIVVSICIMLIIILKSFYYQKIDISFIKDIFSIGATLAAALIAVSLFNDWKEQHNKTNLAPEAIEIYKLINADIKISAEYINLIKNNVNKNLQPLLAVEIFEKFGEFVEIREKRTVELMYFATLAKNEEIGGLIHEYASCVDKQLNYLNPIMRSQQIIDQNFINNNNIFIKELTKIQLEINKKLSDYILLK
ncbi:TPA: hypothetical protein JH913_002323 [Acinetobacter baumannii]|nr:hypothetical protein [Acinetobacter baumannii]HAV3089486.1 hypothetical protein [Acinetobacter baumannii]